MWFAIWILAALLVGGPLVLGLCRAAADADRRMGLK